MTSGSALELSAEELDSLKSLARAHWFSVKTEGLFEWSDKKSIRTTAIAIRSNETVLVEVRDILLSDNHEAFRIAVRKVSHGEPVNADGLEICRGGNAWLADLGILPQPLGIDVVWTGCEYGLSGKHFTRTLTVSVPDALVIHGRSGRFIVNQHPLPHWLAVTRDSQSIEDVLARAERVVRIS